MQIPHDVKFGVLVFECFIQRTTGPLSFFFSSYILYLLLQIMYICVCIYIYIFFFFCNAGVWTQGLHLELLHQSLFCDGFFWDRISWTISPNWLWIAFLLFSASWVARITGVSHQFLVISFFERVSLYSPSWLWTHDPPTLVSQVLGI
jgi:hypothetical protein